MAVWEGKKYKLEKSENYDKLMLVMGVGVFTRKIWNTVAPNVELMKNGDEYTLNTVSTFKSELLKFRLGVEFEDKSIDDRIVKNVMTMEGNKLIQEQKGDKPITIVRDFSDSEMIATMTYNDVKCTRWFKAL